MDEREIVQSLSPRSQPRVPLYLSPPKIDQLYVQTVGPIADLVRSARSSGKLSASFLNLFGAEVSDEAVLEAKLSLTPLVQAMLVEAAARGAGNLVDLSRSAPTRGNYVTYVGSAHLTLMNEPLDAQNLGLSPAVCESLSKERATQEQVLRHKSDDIRTVVLSFTTPHGTFASIASTEFVDFGNIASYRGVPPYGILGRLERSMADHTLLSPLWIWKDES